MELCFWLNCICSVFRSNFFFLFTNRTCWEHEKLPPSPNYRAALPPSFTVPALSLCYFVIVTEPCCNFLQAQTHVNNIEDRLRGILKNKTKPRGLPLSVEGHVSHLIKVISILWAVCSFPNWWVFITILLWQTKLVVSLDHVDFPVLNWLWSHLTALFASLELVSIWK